MTEGAVDPRPAVGRHSDQDQFLPFVSIGAVHRTALLLLFAGTEHLAGGDEKHGLSSVACLTIAAIEIVALLTIDRNPARSIQFDDIGSATAINHFGFW